MRPLRGFLLGKFGVGWGKIRKSARGSLYRGRRREIEDQCRPAKAEASPIAWHDIRRTLLCRIIPPLASLRHGSCGLRLHGLFESTKPTCKSAQERNLQRAILHFADALRRRLEPARCWRSRMRSLHMLADRCDAALDYSKTIASTQREGLRLLLLRGLPLRSLACGLLRGGLRLRLCLLRHSALLALMMRLAMSCSRESSCTTSEFVQHNIKISESDAAPNAIGEASSSVQRVGSGADPRFSSTLSTMPPSFAIDDRNQHETRLSCMCAEFPLRALHHRDGASRDVRA